MGMEKNIIFLFLLICGSMAMHGRAEKTYHIAQQDSIAFDSLISENCIIKALQLQIDSLKEEMKTTNKTEEYMTKDKVVIYVNKCCAVVVGIFIVILCISAIILFVLYKRLRKQMNELEKGIKHYHYKNDKEKSDMVAQLINRKIKPMKTEIKEDILRELKTNHASVPDAELGNAVSPQKDDKSQKKQDMEDYKIVYAKPMRNGCLKETSEPSDSQYIISCHQNDLKGEFKVYEDQEQMLKAIKNREDCLNSFCKAKGSSVGATIIKTLNPGKAERQENGTWKVIDQAEIEFIK